jgi:xanthine dehydrogenase YagS FAD-binding subunit
MRIGAQARNSDVAADPRVRARFPLLADALLAGASPQLRNKASIAGNLLQRTRCPYFYDTAARCNKRNPGAGCAAIRGFNRGHAILGTSASCIATHPSDMAVALVALEAEVELVGGDGVTRRVPVADFHLLPAATPHIETALRPGELVVGILLPPPHPRARQVYRKVRDRASYDFALISTAIVLAVIGGIVTEVRVAFGGVAHKPWRALEAEAVLRGRPATMETYVTAADAALARARGHGHNEFKIDLAKRTLVATLARAAAPQP